MKVLIELQYLPSIAYFSLLAHAEEVCLDICEHFEKQSYRNRCKIIGPNNIQNLSVPVHHAGRKIPVKALEIDYNQKWMNNHWRAIQSAYGKAPFFDFYADFFKNEIYARHTHLVSLNKSLLTICLKLLKLKPDISFAEVYSKTASEGFNDLRSRIHPKKSTDTLTWFKPKVYYQIFGKDFVPNLSILDLLFCIGPDALEVLYSSGVRLKNN